jgi:hypothetical protein
VNQLEQQVPQEQLDQPEPLDLPEQLINYNQVM